MAQLSTLNAAAAQALKTVRDALGIRSGASFARRIAEVAGGSSPDPSTYNRWERGEQLVPAWALMAALHLTEMPLAEIFGKQSAQQFVPDAGRLEEISERLSSIEGRLDTIGQSRSGDVEDLVGSLQTQVMALQDRLALLELASHSTGKAARAR